MDETLAAEELARTVFALSDPESAKVQGPALQGFARYEEVRLLGRGGMGRVVEANDRQFGRRVALKCILGEASVERFGLEAVVTANLEHPGIPAVYERGQDPQGRPFYAMRLIRGRNLEEAIGQARTLDDRLRLLPALIDVAQTIAFAHARGVIHRDLKPQNVVVGAFGDTVVIDWGLAKLSGLASEPIVVASGPGEKGETHDGAVIGTPAYMAPEQAAGRIAEIDARSDVFAIGAMLYQLFAGHPPYRGPNSLAVLALALSVEIAPLSRAAPQTPAGLVAIVERAMARDPADRYPSAGALAEALQELVAKGVRERSGKAVRIFANATSALLTGFMLLVVVAILLSATLVDLGVFRWFVFPTFGIGATLAAIEWWTIGRHHLSPLILALATTVGLQGLAWASISRSEAASALLMGIENGMDSSTLEAAQLQVVPIVEIAQTVGLLFCAALLVLYFAARYRIASAKA